MAPSFVLLCGLTLSSVGAQLTPQVKQSLIQKATSITDSYTLPSKDLIGGGAPTKLVEREKKCQTHKHIAEFTDASKLIKELNGQVDIEKLCGYISEWYEDLVKVEMFSAIQLIKFMKSSYNCDFIKD
jgi:hypothetical protein